MITGVWIRYYSLSLNPSMIEIFMGSGRFESIINFDNPLIISVRAIEYSVTTFCRDLKQSLNWRVKRFCNISLIKFGSGKPQIL